MFGFCTSIPVSCFTSKKEMRKVIVDVDAGTDDYLALLLLLYGEKMGKLKIEAITCCSGNTHVNNVLKNVVRMLEIVKRTDIPVFRGAAAPLIPPQEGNNMTFHGIDGFGDLEHTTEPNLSIVQDKPASIAIADILRKYPNQVELICVAPLTNLALALRLFEDVAENIKSLWIMGGNHSAVGNVTATAEYNFYVDPEAAFIVFDTVKSPIQLLPWETCLIPCITFEWRYKCLTGNNPALTILTSAEKKIYTERDEHWMPCDAFVVFAFLDFEKNSEKTSQHHATIELNGTHTRGQIVLDHLKNKKPNVLIIERIDAEGFKQCVKEVFQHV